MEPSPRDWVAAAAAGVTALILYAVVAPVWLCGADNPEFVTLMFKPGVAHPPGYPLYTLYLRAMAWLPGATPAHSAALATAMLGAGTVATLVVAALRWGASRPAAVLAALLIGVEANVFLLHTHAEVFALNNLIAAGILWLAAPGEEYPTRRAVGLGLLAGLGIANHHTIVLLAPLGLWALWRLVRASERRALTLLGAVGAGALGLVPYAVLLTAPRDCVECLQWGQFNTMADVWHHFLRADYGTTSLGVGGTLAPMEHLSLFGAALARGSLMILPIAFVAGTAALWRRERAGCIALIGAVMLCGPLFIARFNVATEGIGAEIAARFYALPVVLVAPLLGRAIAALPAKALPVAGAVLLVVGAFNAPMAATKYSGVIDAYAHDILEPLPRDAIVFGTGDHRTFGVAYAQQVLEVRTDVTWIDAKLLAYDWYAERAEERLSVTLPRSTATDIPIAEFVARAIATGRPVFLSHMFAEALSTLPSYPIGPVIRLLAAGERPPDPRTLAAQNAELLGRYRLATEVTDVRSAWELEVYDAYARPWLSIAPVLERVGDTAGAERARELARMYGADAP